MNISVFRSSSEIADAVSSIIIDQIKKKPDSVLCFATGSSPLETYDRLAAAYSAGKVSFKDVTTFNLDEYCGLPDDNPNSYRHFMRVNLFDRIDICDENINFLDGCAADPESECFSYSENIKRLGIDIQLLGIGRNGHIGFNEPSERFSEGAHVVNLAESTIEANKRFFNDISEVPHAALTMGIGDIMSAKKILLIATGKAKAPAIKAMTQGEISPFCPASILQNHADVNIFLDAESASEI